MLSRSRPFSPHNATGLPPAWAALIVAGCPPLPDGQPSPSLARRVRLAVALWRQGVAPLLVISGGGPDHGRWTEASVGAALAEAEGVPRSAILEEPLARSTRDNARRTRDLLGDVPVVVVTDADHRFRCERVFRRSFTTVHSYGAPHPWRAQRLVREAVSLTHYALRGWL